MNEHPHPHSHSHSHPHPPPLPHSPKILIVEPTNGLCNRLRAIASGWILSQKTNRTLRVLWNANKDIGYAHFYDLFEKNKNNEHLIIDDTFNTEHKQVSIYTAGIQTEVSLVPKIIDDHSDVVMLKQTGGNYTPLQISIKEFNNLKSEFYKSLIPAPDVTQKINDFMKKNELTSYETFKNVLGVHIRKTDRKKFTPKTEVFADAVNRSHHSAILVCSDDPQEILKLQQLIKQKKILQINNCTFARDNIHDIKQALVEWTLLSKCERIVYSQSSSFGYEACIPNKLSKSIELRTTHKKTDNEKRNLPPLHF